MRPPGDDINYTTRPGEKCRNCRRRAAAPDSGRRKLCAACAPDGRIVAEVTAALKAAGQPPLSAPVPDGGPLHRQRTRGLKAQARLTSRRRASKDATPPAHRQQTPAVAGRCPVHRAV
jgi:hypothetical protein